MDLQGAFIICLGKKTLYGFLHDGISISASFRFRSGKKTPTTQNIIKWHFPGEEMNPREMACKAHSHLV